MDLDNMAAYDSNNEEIHFTPTEFAMLTYLMKNAARAGGVFLIGIAYLYISLSFSRCS